MLQVRTEVQNVAWDAADTFAHLLVIFSPLYFSSSSHLTDLYLGRQK